MPPRPPLPLRRVGCILLIVWQVFCLNIFLPAHTRGAMTVGKACGRQSCCSESAKQEKDDKPASPSPDERSRCSVCYFAAGLSTPPVVLLDLKPSGWVDRIARRRRGLSLRTSIPCPIT